MKTKLIGILIIMLLTIPVLQSCMAKTTFGNEKEIFEDCYVEVTGSVVPVSGNLFQYLMFKHFYIRPYDDDRAFVFLWHIQWMEPDVTVKIFTEENGELLWEDTGLTGVWGMRLFWYNGIYTNDGSTDDKLIVNLQGNVKRVTAFIGE